MKTTEERSRDTVEGNGMGRVVLEVDELRTHFVTR